MEEPGFDPRLSGERSGFLTVHHSRGSLTQGRGWVSTLLVHLPTAAWTEPLRTWERQVGARNHHGTNRWWTEGWMDEVA